MGKTNCEENCVVWTMAKAESVNEKNNGNKE